MKRAFTMIELIFVIVILGILAAVALPKFLGVSQQAHEGNLKSFVGTLNRTVGPTLWSKSISEGHNGDVGYINLDKNNITKYVDLPKEIGDINVSECNESNKFKIVANANKDVAGADYFIACRDGNANQSPVFVLYKQTGGTTPANLGDANTTAYDANPAKYNNDEEGTLLK